MSDGYNGWKNYPTWRVHLEMFDGIDPRDWGYHTTDRDEVAHWAKDWAEAVIEDSSTEGLARDYAIAFLADVDWHEIADSLIGTYMEQA